MLEKKIEDDIKDFLFEQRIYYVKIHGSKFMPLGIPDLLCCVNGYFLGIEVKAPGKLNGQSDEQKIHQENIEKSGGIYLLTDNLDDVKRIVYQLKGNENEQYNYSRKRCRKH